MKTILLTSLLTGLLCVILPPTQTKVSSKELLNEIQIKKPAFDPEWASSLKADEFGMKRYVMAFLKSGPKRDHTPEEAAKIQKGHMENIRKMASSGELIVAGPFMDQGDVRGIYIFNVATIEEAKKLTETDPAIQAGRLEMELHPWYGSAALQLIVPLHDRVAKSNP